MRASFFFYAKSSKVPLKETKVKLKSENQKSSFAGFGINMLFEKGNYKVHKHTLFFFCVVFLCTFRPQAFQKWP